jgi:hypothetical protein
LRREHLGAGLTVLLVAGIGLGTGLRECHGTGPGVHQRTDLFKIGIYFFILDSHGLKCRRSARLFPDGLDCRNKNGTDSLIGFHAYNLLANFYDGARQLFSVGQFNNDFIAFVAR